MDQQFTTAEPPGTSDGGRGATILIVEDSPVQAELLRWELEGAGYQVIVASDGAEGLAMAKANRPAAVVSDIIMPVMDGYAMCQAMRRENSLRTTPVILLTMLSDPEDVIRGLNAGADAYLTKPCNIPSLVARIASLLANPLVSLPEVERRTVEVRLGGKTHLVEASSQRMLNLLISTYENAVQQNRELTATHQALEDLNQHLEQKVLEKTAELRESEQRFRAIIEDGSDVFFLIDRAGTLVYRSESGKQLTGWETADVLGKPVTDYVPAESVPLVRNAMAETFAKPAQLTRLEVPLLRKDGTQVEVEALARNLLDDPDIAGIVITARDITERKRAEQDLRRLNWALRALSQSNTVLVHAGTEKELFQSCCDAIAGTEVYPLAWIGLAIDDPAHSIEVVAAVGEAVKYMQDFKVSWGDTPHGSRPTGIAIRTDVTQVINNLVESDAYLPWIEGARAQGLASSISLPIHANGSVMGALVISLAQARHFSRSLGGRREIPDSELMG